MRKIEEEIKILEDTCKKIDGKSLTWNILNRVIGFGKVGLGIGIYYLSGKNPLAILYTPIAIEGLSDLITGKHHSLYFNLFKIHPKYKIEKLKKEI